ncbi:MAG: hypothetical protein Q8R96_10940 [Bacteroidota bacterium]|nr:hypothetical protein [Bacteroidota bacterium]
MKKIAKPRGIFLKLLALLVILILGINSVIGAELKFNSLRIRQVYEMIPEAYQKEIKLKGLSNVVGSHFLNVTLFGEKRMLICRYNKYNELDHIGLYLIDEGQNVTNIREVFDYVERAFLVSVLKQEKYILNQAVNENGIEVLFNGSSLTKQNIMSFNPKISIDQNTPLNIKHDSKYFSLSWLLEKPNALSIRIPNNYSLITEKTKDELERDLFREMKFSKGVEISKERPSRIQLKLKTQDIYLYQGEIYSTTPELSSSKYFYVNDSIYPVFSNRYYKESTRNLFLNLLPTSVKLNITQKLYGGIDEKFRLNLNTFFGNFSSDYNIYFGWQNDDKDNMKASVFISSKIYNYNHLLVVTTSAKTIFKNNGEVEGLFFAYIPRESDN